jgi:hypothetical protein
VQRETLLVLLSLWEIKCTFNRGLLESIDFSAQRRGSAGNF